ncbi:DUF4296 domain-containing protein [Algoriphagus formosus]|nr:DUF4296 domain-containing protein [Algoriphagus aquimaris]
MMKVIRLGLFLLAILFACESQEKPKHILPENKMVEVLVDIHLQEGIASALPISYDSSQVLYTLLEKEIFLKHGVTDSVFTESMRYYLQYPQKMDELYTQVIDSLVVKESKPDSQEEF